MQILVNESLKKYTTIKIGGIAEKLYVPESTDELINLIKELSYTKLYIISGGSNLLINDKKIFESVISLSKVDDSIKNLGDGKYYIGASVKLQKLINCINNDGYGGIEYLYSLPALTGGAIAMNAGRGKSYNLCISDYIKDIHVYDYGEHKFKIMDKSECQFEYRESIFKNSKLIVLGATFSFEPMEIAESEKRKKHRIETVKKLQDNNGYSFGSVFRTNNKYIMQLVKIVNPGYKNGVKFSKKTSNWLINEGQGTYEQSCRLINKVIKIHKLLGQSIRLEVIKWE